MRFTYVTLASVILTCVIFDGFIWKFLWNSNIIEVSAKLTTTRACSRILKASIASILNFRPLIFIFVLNSVDFFLCLFLVECNSFCFFAIVFIGQCTVVFLCTTTTNKQISSLHERTSYQKLNRFCFLATWAFQDYSVS